MFERLVNEVSKYDKSFGSACMRKECGGSVGVIDIFAARLSDYREVEFVPVLQTDLPDFFFCTHSGIVCQDTTRFQVSVIFNCRYVVAFVFEGQQHTVGSRDIMVALVAVE